jgi:hypothetical protein
MSINIDYEHKAFLAEKIQLYLPKPYVNVNGRVNLRCPFCGDSKKSATKKRGWVYLDKDCSYYCWNCGISMSGIKLLKALSGPDYDSIHHEYIDLFLKSGLSSSLSSTTYADPEEPDVFNVRSIINQKMKSPLSSRAKEYLKSRLVLDAPFLKEPLYSSYAKEQTEEYILIPWKVNGVEAYYQVNDFLKLHGLKYMFPKNKKKLLYGLDNVDPSYGKIFVFEGVYDSLFVKNGIASGTKSITDYQMKLISQRWPHHEICIAFDNDAAGFAATMKMIENGKTAKIFKWFTESTHEKDINEYVISHDDPRVFADETKLDHMVMDKLQMKLWMTYNGKWKKEKRASQQSFHLPVDDCRSVFLLQ